jgi:hypothetical protein
LIIDNYKLLHDQNSPDFTKSLKKDFFKEFSVDLSPKLISKDAEYRDNDSDRDRDGDFIDFSSL